MDAEKVQIQKKQEKQDQKSMEFIKQNVKQQQQSSKTTKKNNEIVKKNIDSKSKPKSDNKNSLFTCQHDKLIGLEMKKFIQNIFIDNIESIINQWLPEIIIELDNFIQQKLLQTINNEIMFEKFIELSIKELNENFPFVYNNNNKDKNDVIKRLNKLYQNDNTIECCCSSMNENKQQQFSKGCYYWPNKQPILMNRLYYELFKQLRSIFKRIEQKLWKLTISIELLRPNIQDSNQTVRRAQRILLKKLKFIKNSLIKSMIIEPNTWLNYSRERLKILTKIFSYPQIIDHYEQLKYFERQQCLYLINGTKQIMLSLLVLHDLLMKNYDYIEHSNSFYTCTCKSSTTSSRSSLLRSSLLFGQNNSDSMMMFN
ncbi:hypothetical protein DERP_000712 [Dermatophagoides pteronyssinus]|uniref:Proteasome activator PA28 C-terminal domain-containing protein n=1 Tax=Dermatophagoides pteronyssinus TaxID=6956 RepID=A0ABQ8J0X4_DERPT|nr:hypothetical protein DERP_000712 [Dermatophagoides pteronyssinus]